jgi:hypothetical protein
MSSQQVEVAHHDPAGLVDLLHRCAGVRLRPPKRASEELDLLALQPVHVRAGEKARQLIVAKHSVVEVLNDD